VILVSWRIVFVMVIEFRLCDDDIVFRLCDGLSCDLGGISCFGFLMLLLTICIM
jgi:hypothetical protein